MLLRVQISFDPLNEIKDPSDAYLTWDLTHEETRAGILALQQHWFGEIAKRFFTRWYVINDDGSECAHDDSKAYHDRYLMREYGI